MKRNFPILPLAMAGALVWGAASMSTAWGQVTSTTTTVTQTPDIEGSFSQWIPGTQSVVVSSAGAEPIHYNVTRTTTVVDENGTPVLMERVPAGSPMSVRYVRTADGLVASKIVVHMTPRGEIIERHERRVPETVVTTPAPAAATTVVTNRGTITEFSPASDTVVLGGGERYTVTRRTTYVDETGAPVSAEQITRGVPVTVDYVDEDGRRVISRVIVSRRVTPPPSVIERRTTTTTELDR